MHAFSLYAKYKTLFNTGEYAKLLCIKEELQHSFDQLKVQLLQQGINRCLCTKILPAEICFPLQNIPELIQEMENTISTMHEIAVFYINKKRKEEQTEKKRTYSSTCSNKKSLFISYLQKMYAQEHNTKKYPPKEKKNYLLHKIKKQRQSNSLASQALN